MASLEYGVTGNQPLVSFALVSFEYGVTGNQPLYDVSFEYRVMVWSEVFVNSCISMEKSCNEQFVNVFSN